MSSPAADRNPLFGIPALGERRSFLMPLPVKSPTDCRARHFFQEAINSRRRDRGPEAAGGSGSSRPHLQSRMPGGGLAMAAN
jgi:hypothetical protein